MVGVGQLHQFDAQLVQHDIVGIPVGAEEDDLGPVKILPGQMAHFFAAFFGNGRQEGEVYAAGSAAADVSRLIVSQLSCRLAQPALQMADVHKGSGRLLHVPQGLGAHFRAAVDCEGSHGVDHRGNAQLFIDSHNSLLPRRTGLGDTGSL